MNDYEGHVYDGSGTYMGEWGEVEPPPIGSPSIPVYGDHGYGYVGEWPAPAPHAPTNPITSTLQGCFLSLVSWLVFPGTIYLLQSIFGLIDKGHKAAKIGDWDHAITYWLIPGLLVMLIFVCMPLSVVSESNRYAEIERREKTAAQTEVEELQQHFPVAVSGVQRVSCDYLGNCSMFDIDGSQAYIIFTAASSWDKGRIFIDVPNDDRLDCQFLLGVSWLESGETKTFICTDMTVRFDRNNVRLIHRGETREMPSEICLAFQLEYFNYPGTQWGFKLPEPTECYPVLNAAAPNGMTLREAMMFTLDTRTDTQVCPAGQNTTYVTANARIRFPEAIQLDFSTEDGKRLVFHRLPLATEGVTHDAFIVTPGSKLWASHCFDRTGAVDQLCVKMSAAGVVPETECMNIPPPR